MRSATLLKKSKQYRIIFKVKTNQTTLILLSFKVTRTLKINNLLIQKLENALFDCRKSMKDAQHTPADQGRTAEEAQYRDTIMHWDWKKNYQSDAKRRQRRSRGLEEAGVNPGLQVQRAQRVVIMKLHKDEKDKNKGGYKGGI